MVVNILTKTKKARRADEKSEIIKVEGPIDISNVMVVCPTCNKATRVARQNDGKSVRICKKCGASLDVEKKAKKTAAKKAVKAEKVEEAAPKATKSTKTTTKKAPVKATKSADAKSTKTTAAKKTSTKKVAKETEGDK